MSDINTNNITLEEAIEIIKQQDQIIGRQLRTIEFNSSCTNSLNLCNNKRKLDAGYNSDVSFDIVWANVLAKAKAFDSIQTDVVSMHNCTKQIDEHIALIRSGDMSVHNNPDISRLEVILDKVLLIRTICNRLMNFKQ